MNRRELTKAGLASLALIAAKPSHSFDLTEETISGLGARMQSGRDTAVSIASKYLARIKDLDHSGPNLRSVIELNPDALKIAADLDKERKAGNLRGPLHGIPVLIKDNIDTADKMMTTAGSLALAGSPAPRDAFIVERLRAAGAVLLGKTNLSEWANFRSTHSVSGWSGRGGQTRNPFALDRNPCGSSSGSGVAVSANLCAAAIGTETDGSIVCPSSMNGIVGIKPTVGLWSRSGIIPISQTQDTAGPMARSVRDAAILLGALAAVDSNDSSTAASAGHANRDYTQFLKADGLAGARLGLARKFMGSNAAVDSLIESSVKLLKSAGAEVIDASDLTPSAVSEAENEVLLYEFKDGLNRYLAARGGAVPVGSLAEVIAWNGAHRDSEMRWFGQELMLQAESKGPLSDTAYKEALAKCRRLSRAEGIDAVLAQHKLDALIAPTAGPAWLTDWINGDHDAGGCSTPAAVAGYPHITVPAGFVYGLPVGLSFFGGAWQEPKLLQLAYAFEGISKARREPLFVPSAPIPMAART